jgi:hypothetical protein
MAFTIVSVYGFASTSPAKSIAFVA